MPYVEADAAPLVDEPDIAVGAGSVGGVITSEPESGSGVAAPSSEDAEPWYGTDAGKALAGQLLGLLMARPAISAAEVEPAPAAVPAKTVCTRCGTVQFDPEPPVPDPDDGSPLCCLCYSRLETLHVEADVAPLAREPFPEANADPTSVGDAGASVIACKVEDAAPAPGDRLADHDDDEGAPEVEDVPTPHHQRPPDPLIRPGGINRREEILIALARIGKAATARDIATAVLGSGETYDQKHYAATYSSLKQLEVTVEVSKKGKLWAITTKGREQSGRIESFLAQRGVSSA
jgi:hypothetical protein